MSPMKLAFAETLTRADKRTVIRISEGGVDTNVGRAPCGDAITVDCVAVPGTPQPNVFRGGRGSRGGRGRAQLEVMVLLPRLSSRPELELLYPMTLSDRANVIGVSPST